MSEFLNLKETKKEYHGTLKSYLIGFFSSLFLTAASFLMVVTQLFTGRHLIYAIVTLALIQAILQLLFFLHLGKEEKPRWTVLVFYFMVMVLLIVAFGSLWIMNDLNDRMMMPMMNKEKNS